MTFIEVLNNPDTRRMVDAIEDTLSSLKGKRDDQRLQQVLKQQIEDLKKASGYEYVVMD